MNQITCDHIIFLQERMSGHGPRGAAEYDATMEEITPRLEALRLEGIVARRSLHGSTTSLQSCLKDPLVRSICLAFCISHTTTLPTVNHCHITFIPVLSLIWYMCSKNSQKDNRISWEIPMRERPTPLLQDF